MTRVKTYIAQVMKANAINIFEIDEQLTSFSEELHRRLIPDFKDYGVSLKRFFVTTIVKPDGDRQYEKFKELHFRQYADIAEAKLRQQTNLIYAQTEAQKVVIDSQAQATKRMQEGYTYAQERGFDVAEMVAQNEAVGQFTNMGVGLGTMAGVGGAVGGVVGGAVNQAMNAATGENGIIIPQTGVGAANMPGMNTANHIERKCPQCGALVSPNAKFCPECGGKLERVCPKCGNNLAENMKFCPECGEKL